MDQDMVTTQLVYNGATAEEMFESRVKKVKQTRPESLKDKEDDQRYF